jgi:hypothetical protein
MPLDWEINNYLHHTGHGAVSLIGRLMMSASRSFSCILVLCGFLCVRANAQTDFEKEPINYYTSSVDDAMYRLKVAIEAGEQELKWDPKTGWLKAVLETLNVPVSSQSLVFSKTSLQLTRINPMRPRALYFNDDVYIGWVQKGDVLEVSAVDPHQGAIFYTISQKPEPVGQPLVKRDQGHCAVCHASSRTENVPGFLVRSVFPSRNGTPLYGLGTKATDHSTPLEDRYGGWYVTGTHGTMRHMGNAIASDDKRPPIDVSEGANLTELDDRVDMEPYLTDTSDLIALMVLEHQAKMHNLITRANYEARRCVHQDKVMNKLLERDEDHQSDSSKRRIAAAGDELLRYMLFADEFSLQSPVKGVSTFRQDFEAMGPRDSQGRSLRQFDLETRLFKYPCSFLIHSESYRGLPQSIRDHVEGRLAAIVTGEDDSEEFEHLNAQTKTSIAEILSDTLDGFSERLESVAAGV